MRTNDFQTTLFKTAVQEFRGLIIALYSFLARVRLPQNNQNFFDQTKKRFCGDRLPDVTLDVGLGWRGNSIKCFPHLSCRNPKHLYRFSPSKMPFAHFLSRNLCDETHSFPNLLHFGVRQTPNLFGTRAQDFKNVLI